MTSRRRRSAGLAGSAAGLGSPAITSVCPPTSNTYSSGTVGGFSGRPMSDGSSTSNSPTVPSVRSQYGWLGGVLAGTTWEASRTTSWFGRSAMALVIARCTLGYRTAVQRTGMRDRTTAVWRSFTRSPGTTSARSATVSTSRPRHAWMIRSSCARLSLTTGSAGSTASRRRIASSAGTPAATSCGLNVAIASSIERAISAPPGTRVHVVSTPSRRSVATGSPASSTNGSIREPSCTGGAPMPKPCVLCMPRLRAAIDANDSPDTGSRPPTSTFTTPGPSGTFAGEPAMAMPPPGFAAPTPWPTLWTMRRACQGRSSRSCSGNAAGSAASRNASTASTADAV